MGTNRLSLAEFCVLRKRGGECIQSGVMNLGFVNKLQGVRETFKVI